MSFRLCALQAAALIVLIAAAFGFAASDDFVHLAGDRDLISIDVPNGRTGSYLGAEWRIEGIGTTSARAISREFPDTALLVHVRINVGAPFEPNEGWQLCRLTLVDDRGRRWIPLGLTLPVQSQRMAALDGRPGLTCSSAVSRSSQRPIDFSFDEFYLVPPDALASLHATVSTAGGRPHYLKLALR
jgi:hypothetical protein